MGSEQFLREGVDVAEILLVKECRTLVDADEHRHRHILAPRALVEDIDSARLRRVALDHAIGLEARQVTVDR